jgi:hypothetical protein
VPLDINEGAEGDTLLEVNLDVSDEDLKLYEWVEELKPYREWLISVALINSKAIVRIIDEDEE